MRKPKRKYWYHDNITVCVICGKETHHKKRVFDEKEKGTFRADGVCSNHFHSFYAF